MASTTSSESFESLLDFDSEYFTSFDPAPCNEECRYSEHFTSTTFDDIDPAQWNIAINSMLSQYSGPTTSVDYDAIDHDEWDIPLDDVACESRIAHQDIDPVQINSQKCQSRESSILSMDAVISINNVVCRYNCGCRLDLRFIAQYGANVEYITQKKMLFMKLKNPYATSRISPSGIVVCSGTTSKQDARLAARRTVRRLATLGFKTSVNNFKIINVFGSCSLPFGVKISVFSKAHSEAVYEPELHLGVTFNVREPKATLKIFSSGSITAISTSEERVRAAIEAVYPKILPYRRELTPVEGVAAMKGRLEPRQRTLGPRCKRAKRTSKKTRQELVGV